MAHTHKLTRCNLLAIVLLVIIVLANTALAQRPEVTFKEGHRSPLMAQISFRDGSQRTVMIIGAGFSVANLFSPYTFDAIGSGDSEVRIWLDTVSSVDEITDKEVTFHMKNGEERRLKLKYDSSQLVDALYLSNNDGGSERIQVSKVKQVKFLNPPRTDKDKHPMLDDWRYSPFTGEKLPAAQ